MNIRENISLKAYNSFGIDVKASRFAPFSTVEELTELATLASPSSIVLLGGGSNILFTKNIEGLVLKNEMKCIRELHEDQEYVYVKAGAGENWHLFVEYCLNHNWAGVENLSLIPGNVGASPIQNIGAYGVQLEDVFWSLEAYHLNEKKIITFTLSDCEFGYRDSIFKKKYKNDLVILSVTFRLRKQPVFHTHYGTIEQELEKMGVKELSCKAISQAVITIRSSKLPDPKVTGNAGSFFKNPSVSKEQYKLLQSTFKNIIGYKNVDGSVKLAAGWMIEYCGWKGFRRGDAGCHAQQALVLVNYGNASGKDILNLSEEIVQSVKDTFNVTLEREVSVF